MIAMIDAIYTHATDATHATSPTDSYYATHDDPTHQHKHIICQIHSMHRTHPTHISIISYAAHPVRLSIAPACQLYITIHRESHTTNP